MRQKALFKAYPTPIGFINDYNPDMQIELIKCGASHADLALNDTIPSIGLLSSTYGDETPIEWLKIQLGSLNDFSEVSKKITSDQLNELASLIVSEYCYLNAAEICLFIGRFKIGKYGSFYGAIDPLKITSALVVYNSERTKDIERKESALSEARKESGFMKVNTAGQAIITGANSVIEINQKAKSDFNEFCALFPDLPKEYPPQVWWKAWRGEENALDLIYGNGRRPAWRTTENDIGQYLCEYNIRINNQKLKENG